jgi:hypothetical protein
MRQYLRHIVLLFILVISSCSKESSSTDQEVTSVRVYEDANIKVALGAVPGDNVVLLIYADNEDELFFKLLNNNGDELWTRSYGLTLKSSSADGTADFQVIEDIENSYAIFHEAKLIRIDYQGNIIFQDDDFYQSTFQSVILYRVMINDQQNYILLGAASVSGNRAFMAEYDRTGQRLSFTLFTINVSYTNCFTDLVKLDDGGYLLAGTAASDLRGQPSYFFTVEIGDSGQQVNTQYYRQNDFKGTGKELIQLKDGKLGYLVSPLDLLSPDGRSRLYILNDNGAILDTSYVNIARSNFGAGNGPYLGVGLEVLPDGSMIGLMHTNTEVSLGVVGGVVGNFESAHFSYLYKLDQLGRLTQSDKIPLTYSNYINSIARLSDGKMLLFGHTLSYGERPQLICIWQ